MRITVKRIIHPKYVDKACSFTINKDVHPNHGKLYLAEHSPIRCALFWVEMKNIYTFVSVHFVRHKFGVEHFCKSNREDRSSYTGDKGRLTPINHAMLINAQALINMSRKRLCSKSHKSTREVMLKIKEGVAKVDPALAEHMVPDCIYRGRCCEMKTCKPKS